MSDDIQRLVEMLKSENPNQRYDACKKLGEVGVPLLQPALAALRSATDDSNPSVAEAAQRALARHFEMKEHSNKEIPEKNTLQANSKEPLPIGQTVGFGAFVGYFTLLILFSILFYPENSRAGIVSFFGIPFGIAGAIAGRHFRSTWLSVVLGSVIGTILVTGSGLLLLLFCFLGC